MLQDDMDADDILAFGAAQNVQDEDEEPAFAMGGAIMDALVE